MGFNICEINLAVLRKIDFSLSERDLISLATFKADNKSNNKVLVTQNDFSFGKASWVLPYFSKDLKHPFLYES